jgi:hypothetical protein
MSLLTRMAISNGNKERKIYANKWLTMINHHKMSKWNNNLQAEVDNKIMCCSPRISYLYEEANMNWFLSSMFEFALVLAAIDALILLTAYIGVYFVKPRWPEWWENNICAPYPEAFELLPLTYSPATFPDLLPPNHSINSQSIRRM